VVHSIASLYAPFYRIPISADNIIFTITLFQRKVTHWGAQLGCLPPRLIRRINKKKKKNCGNVVVVEILLAARLLEYIIIIFIIKLTKIFAKQRDLKKVAIRNNGI